MTNKPLHPCRYAGCSNLTHSKYCSDHQHIEEQNKRAANRFYDLYKRDKKSREFYNSKEWQRVRQQALIRDKGLCQRCLQQGKITYADVVDHITPIKVDWSLRLSLGNTQSLCNPCHNRKTMEDKRRYPQLWG